MADEIDTASDARLFVAEAELADVVRKDDEFVLYRGVHAKRRDVPSLLFLTPVSTRPTPETLEKIEHEYSLRDALNSAWAIRPVALSQHFGQSTLELEDPGGETLDRLLRGPMEMTQFLRVAMGLATALGSLHKSGLVHKDVKPTNVFVNRTTGHVYLTGFGISSRLPRERQAPDPPEVIAGTLAYMAPEQTGRMNRSIDSRSDLYALGVTLYEALTGSLPFNASDPMEWVHCHIARPPVSPAERLPNLPALVGDIVLKLLAKTAEDRYQTAAGLEHDLRRCLAEWEARGQIADFALSEADRPDRLLIPEKLYGRAREIETLLASFDRVVASGTPELVLVSGYSGIGKSAVVNELHKVLVPRRGLFASGKFDQYKRDIPYATLAQAFQTLVRSLLGKPDAELAVWRAALRDALGLNGRLIVDLVPELRLIIGEQPPVAELPAQQAQSRFQMTFRRFVNVFARPEHPLTLFVDDLQWIDPGTLDVVEHLLTQADVQHLLVIGAYRDNEVDADHPLMRRIDAVRQAGTSVQEVRLAPLAYADVEQFVADALRCESTHAESLAQLLHRKTAGNPFFLIQFLDALAEDRLLAFDHDQATWSWDMDRIRARASTDNVVDLMVGKLHRLPPDTQSVLQELSCLGHIADVAMVSRIVGRSEEQIHADLWEALRLELVERAMGAYQFVHDRIQEAAYSLIPEDSRAAAHLRIGRLLATHTPSEQREEAIFEIVNQFDHSAHLISSDEERARVAELYLLAGRRAKLASAYASARSYLSSARNLLKEDAWHRRYDLIFSIECLLAECELLTANMVSAEERLTMLAQRAQNSHDVAVVTRLRLTLYTATDRSDRGVELCLEFLRRDGHHWPLHPTMDEVRYEYDRVWSLAERRPIEELIDLPVITDGEILDALDVLSEVVTPAVFFDEKLSSFLMCRMVQLSIEHGNTDASCFAYVWFAIIARSQFGNYKESFRFGRLGYELVERRGLTGYQARTYMSYANIVLPTTRHVREGCELVRRAFDVAYRNGDLTFAAYSRQQLLTSLLTVGDPLRDALSEGEEGLAFAQRVRFGLAADLLRTQVQFIRTLRGLTAEFGSFDDDRFAEGEFERHLANQPLLAVVEFGYWALKVQAEFLAMHYQAAIQASLKAEPLVWSAPALLETSAFRFYSALSHAAACDSADPDKREQHIEALAEHRRQLKIWAEHAPANFDNQAALVEGEAARIEGRILDAERLYERAIRSAHENGFVHNEAVAYEVAARFYATRGFDRFADAYLREARYCYLRWGADGKVTQLDHLYPHLKIEQPARGPRSTINAPVEILDLATVIKVSQAVSGEMVLEKLIDRLMRSALEHAGAERGFLIRPRGDALQIEAEATTRGDEVIVQLRDAAATGAAMPESLVRYVMRTQEHAILGDASDSNPFSADPYVAQNRARSVLGLPLINQGKLIGVLYLENSLTPHVFTPDRITVLKVLASQAAISLENTRLYHDLENREAKIRRLVDANILAIVIWNVDGAIVASNEAFLRMVQFDREDVTSGRVRWKDMTPAEWRESDERALAMVKETGAVQPYEKELLRKDGSRVPVLVAGALFEEGGSEGVAFALDLTDQKRAEAEIRALKEQLYRENLALRDEIDRASMFEEIVGSSKTLKTVLSRVAKVAPTDSTVFITGETGTGKELIARAVHKRSQRAGRAFVSVNCAALVQSLISSELFGHEKGAFTGATQRRLGRFELADGGTIFLDEVSELLPETQVALLRVLQEREFERVGGTQPIRVDVRLIAATNRDLKAAVLNGTFRQDLFYRLNVFPIEVPPLRDRKDDVLMLVEYFLHRYATRVGKKFRSIDKKTLGLLQLYDWPGNIRELQNVIERSVILSAGDVFSVDELWLSKESPHPVTHVKWSVGTSDESHSEREIIEAALRESRGRVAGPLGAAAKLGIPPSTLEHRIKVLKIRKSELKFG